MATLNSTVSTHDSEITSLQTTKQAAFTAGEGLQFGVDLATGAYELKALSPFWVAGEVAANGTKVSSKGRVDFTSSRVEQGGYTITFNQAHPDGSSYLVSSITVAQTHVGPLTAAVQIGTRTATQMKLILEYRSSGSGGDFSAQFDAIFHFLVLA